MPTSDKLLLVDRHRAIAGWLVVLGVVLAVVVVLPMINPQQSPLPGKLTPHMTEEDLKTYRTVINGMGTEVAESQGTAWAKCGLALIQRGYFKNAIVLFLPERNKPVLYLNAAEEARSGNTVITQTGGALASSLTITAQTSDFKRTQVTLAGSAAVCMQQLLALYKEAHPSFDEL